MQNRLSQLPHEIIARLREPARFAAPAFSPVLGALLLAGIAVALICFPIDSRISRAMITQPDGALAFLRIATDIGLVRWYLWSATAIMAVTAALLWFDARRDDTPKALRLIACMAYLFASVSIAGIITNILKVVFGRARPMFLDEVGSFSFELFRFGNDYASFPSGHSTTIGAVTGFLLVLLPRARLVILIAGLCLALSRIVVRAHFPSDVAMGFTIGLVTSIFLARWLARRDLALQFANGGKGWRGLLPALKTRKPFIDDKS